MGSTVSIIITCRNYSAWLSEAIDSALRQSWPEVEIVVVDDGSTDRTPEIISGYAERGLIKPMRLEGVGLAAACNAGIGESTGDYIVRLDADDYFSDQLVLVLATYLDHHLEVGVVYGDHYLIDRNGDLLAQVQRMKLGDELELMDRPALGTGVMYRRACYEKVGGYDAGLRYQEDYDFWLKMLATTPIENIRLPLWYYRQHSGSMSTNWDARMASRQYVKRRHADQEYPAPLASTALVWADAVTLDGTNAVLLSHRGVDLLERTVQMLRACRHVERILVVGDSAAAARAEVLGAGFVPLPVGDTAALTHTEALQLMREVQSHLDETVTPLCAVSPRTPFLTSAQVDEAFDTLQLYDVEMVVAVTLERSEVWCPSKHGLAPLHRGPRQIIAERDSLYRSVPGFLLVGDHGPETCIAEAEVSPVGHIEVAPLVQQVITSEDEWLAACERWERPTASDDAPVAASGRS